MDKLPMSQSRPGSKKAKLIELLKDGTGQSLPDLVKALGWQAHTVRAAISRDLHKGMGLKVERIKSGNDQVYRIA